MNELMEKRSIGRTGLETHRLGIGSTFDAPAEAIEAAFEWGVNYLYWGTVRQPDFAKAMRNIAKTRRDDMILTIQSYSDDPATIEAEVAEQIQVSGINHYDFLLLGNRMEKPHDGYIETFERMRAKGMVRFLSLSSHNRPLIPELLDEYARGESPYDLLMFRYNAVHRGAERDVFPTSRPLDRRSRPIPRRDGGISSIPTKCRPVKRRCRRGIATAIHFRIRRSIWSVLAREVPPRWRRLFRPLKRARSRMRRERASNESARISTANTHRHTVIAATGKISRRVDRWRPIIECAERARFWRT